MNSEDLISERGENLVLQNEIQGKSLKELSTLCHKVAREKGFWDEERNLGEALMLVVTELAEAMESYRRRDDANFREELADTFIRLLDLCGGLKIDIESEIAKKYEKNKTRPYKHGKVC
jgi:NTP pyrophosphatase (non-canonical NTP hydrolase)